MFSRKPKSIISKVIGLTTNTNAKEASHTWMGDDKTRQARFGSASRETFEQRRQIDRERKTVSRYSDSRIGTSSTRARGDIAKAANREREKIRDRFDGDQANSSNISNPLPPQPSAAPPVSDRSFYPEFRPKL